MAGGLVSAAKNMQEMGGNALQIFSGSPRSWARKPLSQVDFSPFLKFCKEQDFGPTFIHALYLVNLASEKPELVQNSINSIIYDLKFSAAIAGAGVVVHLGSHLGKGFASAKQQVVDSVIEILKNTPENSTFIIENSAGQNGKIASNFAEIREILDELSQYKQRVGWCFDTCHAFANGYKLDSIDEEIDKYSLWDSLKVIHLNDSRDVFASGRDRHENIGEGAIGKQNMKRFLLDQRYAKYPLILEVPGFDNEGPDKKNIDIVKEMMQ